MQDSGGLPQYICRIARAVKRSGHTTSEAIAIAVGQCRNWAHGHGGHVTPKTRAKAAAALAEWEALKVKSKARTAAKHAGDKVAASHRFVDPTAADTDRVMQEALSRIVELAGRYDDCS